MQEGIKKKAAQGVLWTGIEGLSQQGLQFAIGIILARLLSPSEFGLLGLVTVFLIVIRTFVDSGFTLAVIQSKNISHLDESSVFYFNIFLSVVAAALFFLSSHAIANFYEQPDLINITRALSVVFVVDALGAIHQSLLRKAINFKPQVIVSTISRLLSGTTAIIFAFKGYGVWALVIQIISQSIFSSISYWLVSQWRPLHQFSFQSIKRLFGFGSKILMGNIFSTISNNAYLLVIGKVFSPSDLGFYSRAKQFAMFPQALVSSTVSKVSFSVFSSLQDQKERLIHTAKKSLELVMLVNVPAFAILLVSAKPLILLLLTDKWLETVPYLQLFCILGMLFPLHSINIQILLSSGRSDLNLKLELIKNSLLFLNLFINWRFGITAILIGQIALSLIALSINTYFTTQLFDYGLKTQIKQIYAFFILTALAIAPAYYFIYLSNISMTFITLSLIVVLTVGLYMLLHLLIRPKYTKRLFHELKSIIKP